MKLDEFLEHLKPIILNPQDARRIVAQNPEIVGAKNLHTLRDFVESMEAVGFPRAKLMRKTLTLLEQIAKERKAAP